MFEEQENNYSPERVEEKKKDFKKYVPLAIGAGIVLIVILAFIVLPGGKDEETSDGANDEVRGIEGDPRDIVLDFYRSWLEMRTATSTEALSENPLQSQALSVSLQERLSSFDPSADSTDIDPVLCRTTLPPGFRSKAILEEETHMQIMVLSEDKTDPTQAVVTLMHHDNLWEITDITCNSGEEAPDFGEFSFDNNGSLLKDSLPDRFDKNYWYLVYEQDGTGGFTAALLLDNESVCITQDGTETVCSNELFYEAMRVHVQGQMTEGGVDVEQIEIR